MRASEFLIEEQPARPGYYTVGDSTAYNIGMSNSTWNTLANPGSQASNAVHKNSLALIPKGSTVAISVGADEIDNETDPQTIAASAKALVDFAKTKGLKPIFVLFPPSIGQNRERADAIRNAILNSVPTLDMKGDTGIAKYNVISQQIIGGPSATTASGTQQTQKITKQKSYAPVTGLNFKPGVDSRISPQLASIVQRIFAEYGQNLPIESGYRDPARNKKAGGAKNSAHMRHNAVDIDTRSLSHEERLKLIRIASANGIGGIGVYNNNLHFDIENKRAWGPNFSRTSIPGWASKTIAAHLSGQLGSQYA